MNVKMIWLLIEVSFVPPLFRDRNRILLNPKIDTKDDGERDFNFSGKQIRTKGNTRLRYYILWIGSDTVKFFIWFRTWYIFSSGKNIPAINAVIERTGCLIESPS